MVDLINALIMFEGEATGMPDFTQFISTLQAAITPAQLLTVLGSVVGVGIGFVLMWFGVRRISKSFTSAVMRGKLRV